MKKYHILDGDVCCYFVELSKEVVDDDSDAVEFTEEEIEKLKKFEADFQELQEFLESKQKAHFNKTSQ